MRPSTAARHSARPDARPSRGARLRAPLALGSLEALPADEGAWPNLLACARQAFDYFRRVEGAASPEQAAADRLGEALADETRRLFVLVDADGSPAGLLDLALDTPCPREVTLALLVLAPRLRGTGRGREAVEALAAALARAGFCRLRLGVAPGEDDAARFWEAMGMWPAGVDEGVRLFERPLR